VLVYAFFGILASTNSIVVAVALLFSFPVQVAFIVLLFLTVKIFKGHMIIKRWQFIAAYIAICIVAMPYFGHVIRLITISIRAGRFVL